MKTGNYDSWKSLAWAFLAIAAVAIHSGSIAAGAGNAFGPQLADGPRAEAPDTPSDVIKMIRQHIKDGHWKAVAALMTDQAWDEFCARLIVECKSLTNIEFDIPGLAETQDAVEKVLEDHGFDELEIKVPAFELKFGGGDDEPPEDLEEKLKSRRVQREQTDKQILELLANSDQTRESIVRDLWQARKDSPFAMNLFASTIEQSKIDGETAVLKLQRNHSHRGPDDSSAVVVIASPPVFVDMIKESGSWKFAGINQEKTAQALRDFRPANPRDRGRSDY